MSNYDIISVYVEELQGKLGLHDKGNGPSFAAERHRSNLNPEIDGEAGIHQIKISCCQHSSSLPHIKYHAAKMITLGNFCLLAPKELYT